MNWNRNKSVALSRVCLIVFAVMLLCLDAGAYWFSRWFFSAEGSRWVFLMITVYSASIFAWICLYMLWRLTGNIRKGEVFVRENVTYLRAVSWCCAAVGVICLASVLYYLSFAFVAIAAGFMSLIVRIVKNVFDEAIGMKSELDLTV
ncbi:MAG: DUF2975 domain-containing protein [Oscillospiraceae bacterium]|nr:DUF2975 domain-containing protein [Oscillospiraceae bacterium]